MPPEGQKGGEHNHDSSSPLEEPIMVSDAPGIDGGFSPSPTTSGGLTEGPNGPTTPSSMSEQPETDCLASVWKQHTTIGVSRKTSELLLAGWSRGTNKAYQSGWNQWMGWCQRRKVDPISCRVQPFLDFTASLFEEGLQYRSINTIRSAVSSTHHPMDGAPIGQHPLVRQLFKGVYNSRPPQPRYTHTWDVSTVLVYIKQLGENKDLSLKQLSLKLAMHMSLTSTNRTSELQALDLRFRHYNPNGVVFRLASLTKKRQLGALVKECSFASFTEDPKLCVVQCLRQYEAVTQNLRTITPEKAAFLFLSYIKPHKPVTSQRLAH